MHRWPHEFLFGHGIAHLRSSASTRHCLKCRSPYEEYSGATRLSRRTYLATLTGLPLFKVSSSARDCASRSIKSANLLIRRDLSVPVTFLPHVVLNASRAAATAASMSFDEAIAIAGNVVQRARYVGKGCISIERDSPLRELSR